MSCQINAEMKLCSKKKNSIHILSFLSPSLGTHGVILDGIYGMFALLILRLSYGTDLLSDTATWQRLKSPDCIWYDTHQHTIFVKTCGLHTFFSPSFPRLPLRINPTTTAASFFPSILHPFLGSSAGSEARRRRETQGDRQKHFYQQ